MILYVILLLLISSYILLVYKKSKKVKWFNSLKPDDKILVTIYSKNCDCKVIATVSNKPNGKYLSAVLDDDSHKNCEQCSLINGKIDSSDENTCWYKVTSFHINNVNKIN